MQVRRVYSRFATLVAYLIFGLWHEPALAVCTHPDGEVPFAKLGDVTGSGTVNVADALCVIMSWLVSQGSPAGAVPWPACVEVDPQLVDVDCSGDVDLVDVSIIVLLAHGVTPEGFDAATGQCPVGCGGPASPAEGYHVQDLGVLPGTTQGRAASINASGWIAGQTYIEPSGGSNLNSGGSNRAVVWKPDAATGLWSVAELGALAEWAVSRAWAINDAGVAVGISGGGWAEGEGGGAAHWVEDDSGWQITNLGAPAPCTRSWAYGVSEAGHVAGNCRVDLTSESLPQATAWLASEGGWDAEILPNAAGASQSYAEDVNDTPLMVGFTVFNDGFEGEPGPQFRGTIWTHGAGGWAFAHPGPPPGAWDWSIFRAVNANGWIVGSAWDLDAWRYRPVVWVPQDGTWTASPLPGLVDEGWGHADGVNDAGQVVGITLGADGVAYPVLWQLDEGGVWSVGTLPGWSVSDDAPGFPDGVVGRAHDINDHGDAVGYAYLPNGEYRPVIWTTPQP